MIDKIYKIKLGLVKSNRFEKLFVYLYEKLIGFSPSKSFIYLAEPTIAGFKKGISYKFKINIVKIDK